MPNDTSVVEPPTIAVQPATPVHTQAWTPITKNLLEDVGHPKRKKSWTGKAEALVANGGGWGDVNRLHPKKKA
jgi:NAD(P)H-dependent FMN reductase